MLSMFVSIGSLLHSCATCWLTSSAEGLAVGFASSIDITRLCSSGETFRLMPCSSALSEGIGCPADAGKQNEANRHSKICLNMCLKYEMQ